MASILEILNRACLIMQCKFTFNLFQKYSSEVLFPSGKMFSNVLEFLSTFALINPDCIVLYVPPEHSHPLIHTSYQQTSLPEAELEEEVVESNAVLTSGGNEASEPCHRDRDSPYLRFEITSADGFSVQADTCEGILCFHLILERLSSIASPVPEYLR